MNTQFFNQNKHWKSKFPRFRNGKRIMIPWKTEKRTTKRWLPLCFSLFVDTGGILPSFFGFFVRIASLWGPNNNWPIFQILIKDALQFIKNNSYAGSVQTSFGLKFEPEISYLHEHISASWVKLMLTSGIYFLFFILCLNTILLS